MSSSQGKQINPLLLIAAGFCFLFGVMCLYPPIPMAKYLQLAKMIATFFGGFAALFCLFFGFVGLCSKVRRKT